MYYKIDVNDLEAHPLSTYWEREFLPSFAPSGREILIFEGEAHIIDALKAITEGFRVPEPPDSAPTWGRSDLPPSA